MVVGSVELGILLISPLVIAIWKISLLSLGGKGGGGEENSQGRF